MQNDGKIIIAGTFTLYNDSAVSRIVRLDSNGVLDKTFNTGLGLGDVVYSVLLQPDGKILVAGRFAKYRGITRNSIVRLMPDGEPDTTFKSGTGFTTGFPSAGLAFVYSLKLQSDGKIIATGNFTQYNGIPRYGIVRIDTNGNNDNSFITGPGFNDITYNSIVQSDGKILVTGRFSTYKTLSRNGIVRLQANGMLDSGFNPGTGFNRSTKALAFHKGERVLVGGEFTDYNGECRTRIARLLACEKLSKDIKTSCSPVTWIDGKTYSASTNNAVYEMPGASANGCDSFVLLNLTVNKASESVQTVQTCNASYVWIDGKTYTSSTDSAKYTISGGAKNGCDSIISLKLTIKQPVYSTDYVMACKSHKWIDGITYTKSTVTPKHTLRGAASNGCDSVISLTLTILNANTTVQKTLDILTSNAVSAVYQWLDCDDGYKPVAGATNRMFAPDSSGNYAVAVTENGCTDTSDCIEVILEPSSIRNHQICSAVLYPSPSDGTVFISNGDNCSLSLLRVYDQQGRTVRTISEFDSAVIRLDLHDLKGIYFVELLHDNGTIGRYKVVMY